MTLSANILIKELWQKSKNFRIYSVLSGPHSKKLKDGDIFKLSTVKIRGNGFLRKWLLPVTTVFASGLTRNPYKIDQWEAGWQTLQEIRQLADYEEGNECKPLSPA